MSLKHFLSVFGLFCDLSGAFFLSVPMVWDTKAFVVSLSWLLKWIFKILGIAWALFAFVMYAIIVFSIIAFIIHTVVSFVNPALVEITGHSAYEAFPGMRKLREVKFDDFVNSIFLCVVIMVSPALIVRLILSFAEWIQAGDKERERKVGRIGLVILVFGFIAQAIINFLPEKP
jgi:hypothetical protein